MLVNTSGCSILAISWPEEQSHNHGPFCPVVLLKSFLGELCQSLEDSCYFPEFLGHCICKCFAIRQLLFFESRNGNEIRIHHLHSCQQPLPVFGAEWTTPSDHSELCSALRRLPSLLLSVNGVCSRGQCELWPLFSTATNWTYGHMLGPERPLVPATTRRCSEFDAVRWELKS